MKLNEIIDLKPTQQQLSGLIKVELPYIPLADKRNITDNIARLSVYVDETTILLMHDVLAQRLLSAIHRVLYLTDIEIENILDENNDINIEIAVNSYDKMIQNGILQHIEAQLVNDDIDEIVNYKIKQNIETYNSVSNVLRNIVTDLVSKIPSQEDIGNLMTSLPSQIEGLKDLKILNGLNTPTQNTKKPSKSKSKKSPNDIVEMNEVSDTQE